MLINNVVCSKNQINKYIHLQHNICYAKYEYINNILNIYMLFFTFTRRTLHKKKIKKKIKNKLRTFQISTGICLPLHNF